MRTATAIIADSVTISIGGMVVGGILFLICYWIGEVAARDLHSPVLKMGAMMIGLLAFVLLALEFHST